MRALRYIEHSFDFFVCCSAYAFRTTTNVLVTSGEPSKGALNNKKKINKQSVLVAYSSRQTECRKCFVLFCFIFKILAYQMLTVHCLWKREIHVRVTVVIRKIRDINSVEIFPMNLYNDSSLCVLFFPRTQRWQFFFCK